MRGKGKEYGPLLPGGPMMCVTFGIFTYTIFNFCPYLVFIVHFFDEINFLILTFICREYGLRILRTDMVSWSTGTHINFPIIAIRAIFLHINHHENNFFSFCEYMRQRINCILSQLIPSLYVLFYKHWYLICLYAWYI